MTHARIAATSTIPAANPRRMGVREGLAGAAGSGALDGVASVTGSTGGGCELFGISARTGAAPDSALAVETGPTAKELGAAVATSSGGIADDSGVSIGKFARPRLNASLKVGAL